MDGALLGGLVAAGFAALALAASVGLGRAPDADTRTMRIIGRTIVLAIAVLGLIVVALGWSLESDVEAILGLALGLVMGLGAFGVLVVLRTAVPGPEGRSRTLVLMFMAEAVAVLACVGLILAIILATPA